MDVFKKIIFIAGISLLMYACDKEKQTVSEQDAYPRAQTLYIGGFDWAAPTTFNPLAGDPNFPIDGNIRVMYESLVSYNMLSGESEPMLATGYTQTDSSISVMLDTRAQWSDGKPVTAEDVFYSFYLDSIFPTPRHNGWAYLEKIEIAKADSLVFHMQKENRNPLLLLNLLSETSILPKHIFEPLAQAAKQNGTYDYAKILEFQNNTAPVVSGPYNLESYSAERIILKRRDDYWGKIKYNGRLPAPVYIIHSLYSGNNHFNSAMTRGNLDESSIFMPRIWEKKRDNIRAWSENEPYHLPGSIPTLFIATQTAPFNNVAFRRALAHAVNFEKIKERAVSNYTPAMQAGFILPFGNESVFFDAEDAENYGYRYDPAKARLILQEAGYSWDSAGALLDPAGAKVREMKIECPQGWTDWEDAIKVVVGSFAEIGIPAKESFVDYGTWEKNLRLGTFDLSMKTQTADLSAATPWIRFDQVMNSIGNPPLNQDAFSNQGRYRNENADLLLTSIPSMTDSVALKAAYRELNRIFMEEIPVLPLMYRPTQYYQFSEKHWTNFPTEENPYAPPQNLIIAASVKALWEIKPVSAP